MVASYAKAVVAGEAGTNSRDLKSLKTTEATPVISYGVACVRKNPDNGCYEVLMIKKRSTYAFIEFVRGMYDPYKDADIEYMFDRMTIIEKSMIRTRNFDTVWNYCNDEFVKGGNRSIYARSLRKYTALIERSEHKIVELLSKTKNASLLWEIPKGRPNRRETSLSSAVREFEEETGLSKDAYQILFDEGTIRYSFIDCGVKYVYIYYLGVLNKGYKPLYDYDNQHMLREVGDIKFLSSVATQELNDNRLAKIVRIIIKKCKRYI